MKNTRKGLGKGLGCGYKNIAPMDAHIHSLSAKGVSTYAKRVVSEGFYHTPMGDVETWEKVDDKTYESECSDCGYIGGGFYEVSGKDLWDSYSYGVCPKCSNNKDMVKVIKNIIKNKDKSDIDLAKEFMASFNDDWDKLEQYQKEEAIKYIKGIKKDKDKFSLDAKGVDAQELKNELANFTGTEQYHKVSLTPVVVTDGVKYLIDKANSYWLIDAIGSYQTEKKFKAEGFQVWILKKDKDGKGATLSAYHDYSEKNPNKFKPLVTQKIEYTDFPLDEIKLYEIDGVVLLPSEY
jgi:hypothetical protein